MRTLLGLLLLCAVDINDSSFPLILLRIVIIGLGILIPVAIAIITMQIKRTTRR
jgi:hypothetical protein